MEVSFFRSDTNRFQRIQRWEEIDRHSHHCQHLFRDKNNSQKTAVYEVRPVLKGKETHHIDGTYTFRKTRLSAIWKFPAKPADGITPAGDTYTYSPNDASIGDVDGDGEYEIILKWDPSNSHDNAHEGYTGEVYIDCYRMNGEQLWRINLGKTYAAGAHYTQFMVYDLDGDGKAEVVMRTADGTVDGKGKVIEMLMQTIAKPVLLTQAGIK